jgi:hypothetical protein
VVFGLVPTMPFTTDALSKWRKIVSAALRVVAVAVPQHLQGDLAAAAASSRSACSLTAA